MKVLLLFSTLALSIYSNAQTKKFVLIDDIYANWHKSYNNDVRKCHTFLYSDIIDDYTNERVQDLFEINSVIYSNKDTLNADKIIFTLAEKNYVIKELQKLNHQKWPDAIFPKSKVITFNHIDSIQKSINAKKVDPLLRLCYTVYIFSHPIFLRENSICLFYSGKTNFAVKDGEFRLYKKQGSDWVKFAPLYRWIE